MSKLVVVHCICTLVRFVAVSYNVITIQVMLQFVIKVKIPIETTKKIKALELLNSFSVFLFFLPFPIIPNSQP